MTIIKKCLIRLEIYQRFQNNHKPVIAKENEITYFLRAIIF